MAMDRFKASKADVLKSEIRWALPEVITGLGFGAFLVLIAII